MKVEVKLENGYIKGTVLDLTLTETITVISALDTLHKSGGRNEIDRVASKEMRQQIMSLLERGKI